MAIKTLTVLEATVGESNKLLPDYTTTATKTLTGTGTVTASFQIPSWCGVFQLEVPTLPSCTFRVRQKTAGVVTPLKYDMDGTAYPRTTYTGLELLTFVPMFGAIVQITASAVSATAPFSHTFVAQARR